MSRTLGFGTLTWPSRSMTLNQKRKVGAEVIGVMATTEHRVSLGFPTDRTVVVLSAKRSRRCGDRTSSTKRKNKDGMLKPLETPTRRTMKRCDNKNKDTKRRLVTKSVSSHQKTIPDNYFVSDLDSFSRFRELICFFFSKKI